jgi:hypothetical protein
MKWTSVDEGLPERDGNYLVVLGDYNIVQIRRFDEEGQQWWLSLRNVCAKETDVTYWMPLPALPTNQK